MEDLIEYIRLLLCADSDLAILLSRIGQGIAVFLITSLLFVGWVSLWNKVWWKNNLRLIVGWGGVMMALLCAATGMVKDVSQNLQKDENAKLLCDAIQDKVDREITWANVWGLAQHSTNGKELFKSLCRLIDEKRLRNGFFLEANLDQVLPQPDVEKCLDELLANSKLAQHFQQKFETDRQQIVDEVTAVIAKSQREKNLDSIEKGCHLNPWRCLLPLGVTFMILFARLAVRDIKE